MSNTIDESIWDSVTVLRKKHNTKEAKKNAKKETVVKNSGKDVQMKNIKLDNSTEAAKHKTVSRELSQKIIRARVDKKWKQKDLANNLNLCVSIINEYECGKAIIDNKILCKIERALNIKR
jgi:ribosome-binding protein aMBF1 (putative translation factor)